MNLNLIVSFIGVIGTLSSIFFAYLAFRRNSLIDQRNEGKHQGTMFSDIGYIKACVDRVEKNIARVDERYHDIVLRLTRNEEVIENILKRIELLEKR